MATLLRPLQTVTVVAALPHLEVAILALLEAVAQVAPDEVEDP